MCLLAVDFVNFRVLLYYMYLSQEVLLALVGTDRGDVYAVTITCAQYCFDFASCTIKRYQYTSIVVSFVARSTSV